MDDKIKPSYYAIIPANVRYDPNLKANSKLLYGEITALANDLGYCFSTNKYFSELYNVSKETVSRWVKELIDNGHITSEIIYKEDSKEILKRHLRLFKKPIDKNVYTPIDKKVKDNNTSININIVDSIYKLYPTKCPVRKTASTGKSKSNKDKIKQLLQKGEYTPEELSAIIKRYIKECVSDNVYVKNFKTFLNNIPDFEPEKQVKKEINKQETEERYF